MHMPNLVKDSRLVNNFYEWLQIYGRNNGITEYRKDRTTEGQGESSIAPLFQSGAIIIVAF